MLVRLLGGVEVSGPQGRWRTVPGKRAAVLAVLTVAAGEAVPADELVHRVWGGAATDLADGAVYPHITRLRATLAPTGLTVSRSGGGYVLDVDAEQVDLLAVRRLAARAREATEAGRQPEALDSWRRATALLRGEALAGVDGVWAVGVRQRFNAEVTSILTERFGCELRLGRHLAIVDELLAAQARHPDCEPLAELLMLALYRCGRQAEALEVFTRAESRLREQLGIDPSESFRRLHRQVLNQDETISAPREVRLVEEPPLVTEAGGYTPPAQLPAPPRSFVGREAPIEELRRAADRSPVVVVDGMPGVGKTAIAVHTATLLAEWYPDGQLFVELHGFSGDVAPTSPADALERMLRGLGAEDDEIPADPEERSAALRTRLAGRRVLIVLDNAADAAQVRPLLPGGPDCLTIVTSRRRMPDLLDAAPITLEVMDPDEAVRVLAVAVDDPRRVAADSAVAAEIVEVTGRLPLAIRLIAARLRNRRHWTLDYLLRRLRDRPVLDELSAQDAAVASAFTVSYGELDEAEQRMFRLLGLYPGRDFDAGFAAALAQIAPQRADRSLEELVDAHLLQSDEPGRYRFHDLMRHFAATLAAETETPAELAAARHRLYDTAVVLLRHAVAFHDSYVGYYPRLVDPVDPPDSPWAVRAEAAAWVRRELPNLKAVLSAASEQHMDRHCAELAAAMSALNSLHHADHDLDRIGQWGLDSARRIRDREAESYFLNKLAGAHQAWGDVDLAERLHKQALAVRRRLGDARYIISSLSNLALVYGHAGEYDRAVELRGEAVELAAASRLTEFEAVIRMYLGGSLCSCGRITEARTQLERAAELLADSGEAFARISLTAHLGVLHRFEGRPADAERLHAEALAEYRSVGHGVGQVQMHTEIAEDLIAQSRWDEAWDSSAAALELLGDIERPELRAEISLAMAEVCLARGHFDDAREQLRAVAEVGRRRKSAVLRAKADWGLARASRALGDERDAGEHAERALTYFSRFQVPQADGIRRFLAGQRGGGYGKRAPSTMKGARFGID